jgi:hypothetical protein
MRRIRTIITIWDLAKALKLSRIQVYRLMKKQGLSMSSSNNRILLFLCEEHRKRFKEKE